MKKVIIILILIFTTTGLSAQSQSKKTASTDSFTKKQNDEIDVYQLFPTNNMWTFIKLNTRNGQMWQVQFSVNGERSVIDLNSISLVLSEEEKNGRFNLYPTENIWTFILLDQIDGRTWQVQWSNEAEKRGLMSIN